MSPECLHGGLQKIYGRRTDFSPDFCHNTITQGFHQDLNIHFFFFSVFFFPLIVGLLNGNDKSLIKVFS